MQLLSAVGPFGKRHRDAVSSYFQLVAQRTQNIEQIEPIEPIEQNVS